MSTRTLFLRRYRHLFGIALFYVLLSSCTSTKNTVYFRDLPADQSKVTLDAASFSEPIIMKDDILNISIQTIDPTTSAVANQAISSMAVGSSTAVGLGNQVVSGYLVDKNGAIQITALGSIEVAGLTTYAARIKITELATKIYKNPTVDVRFANYKITVLGEVARPATYAVPNEKVSILDALGLAGDLTIFGRRDNVLLVREQGNQKEFVRFNLNDSHLFQSPYFYLKQNDVLYVEATKGKAAANNAGRTQAFAIIGTVLSLVIVAISRF